MRIIFLNVIIFLSIFSSNLNASSESERLAKEKSLDEIFISLDKESSKSKYELYVDEQANLYAIKYIQLLESKLGDLSSYSEHSCSLELTLSEIGKIKKVTSNHKSKFCAFITTKLRKINNLPVPANLDVRKKVLKIHFLVQPQ